MTTTRIMYPGIPSFPGLPFNAALLIALMLNLCMDGFRADCPKNCQQCSSDGTRCHVCKDGYYGSWCHACSPLCLNSKCVPKQCSDGCVRGRYGQLCQKKCDCFNGCDQWTGHCSDVQKKTQQPISNIDYHILVGLLAFGAIGVLLTVGVFMKQKKFPYRRCLCIPCDCRTKKTHKVSKGVLRMRKSHSEISSPQQTSSFCITPTTPTGCTDVRHLAEAEPILIGNYRPDIVLTPPLTSGSEDESKDEEEYPSMYNSLFPHRKHKTKRAARK